MAVLLAGCGNKETKTAMDKAQALASAKPPEYQEANKVLLDALRARETVIRGQGPSPTDQASTDAMLQKVQSDDDILKMERAQISLYIRMERADLAAAVYSDILTGHPGDTVVYDSLTDKDPIIRQGAVRTLGLSQKADAVDPNAISALTAATKDTDQDVRRAAVVALGTINDPRTTAPLIAALKDSYWFVRSEAASALGQEHDPLAVKPLLDALDDSDETVQDAAQTALLLICRVPGANKDDFASRLNDSNPKAVLIAAMCLGLMKDPRAVPVLESMMNSNDPETRLGALKALGETSDPSVIPILRQTLKDSDVNMRGWSIIGLGNLQDKGSIADLTVLANDPTQPSTIQSAAAAALRHISNDDAAPTDSSTPSASSGP